MRFRYPPSLRFWSLLLLMPSICGTLLALCALSWLNPTWFGLFTALFISVIVIPQLFFAIRGAYIHMTYVVDESGIRQEALGKVVCKMNWDDVVSVIPTNTIIGFKNAYEASPSAKWRILMTSDGTYMIISRDVELRDRLQSCLQRYLQDRFLSWSLPDPRSWWHLGRQLQLPHEQPARMEEDRRNQGD